MDTVGLFHSTAHDDPANANETSQPEISIFTLDGIRRDLLASSPPPPAPSSPTAFTPLDNCYRYHLFFCHHERDSAWVDWAVGRLETAPYRCSCCLARRDFDANITRLQNVLCSVTLSRKVVFVVSTAFLDDRWMELEEGLTQTTACQGHGRQRRIVSVILEDCVVGVIPDMLRMEPIVDARHEPHSESILKTLVAGTGNDDDEE